MQPLKTASLNPRTDSHPWRQALRRSLPSKFIYSEARQRLCLEPLQSQTQAYMPTNGPRCASFHLRKIDFTPRYITYPSAIDATVIQNSLIHAPFFPPSLARTRALSQIPDPKTRNRTSADIRYVMALSYAIIRDTLRSIL